MAFQDDMTYIRNRCNRILILLDLRTRPTFSIDPTADAFGDATDDVTPAMRSRIDNKITGILSELKARAAVSTYP